MDLSFIKNPYIITAVSGLLVYTYLYYDLKKKNRINKKKKRPHENINMLIPIAIMVLVFIISYKIFDSDATVAITPPVPPVHNPEPQVKLIGGHVNLNLDNANHMDDFGNGKYLVINRQHVKLPSENVFLDIAKF